MVVLPADELEGTRGLIAWLLETSGSYLAQNVTILAREYELDGQAGRALLAAFGDWLDEVARLYALRQEPVGNSPR